MTDVDTSGQEEETGSLSDAMARLFGIPNPSEMEFKEIFGWYHVYGDTRYWVHDPHSGSFDVVSSDGQWMRPVLAGEWSEDELEEVRQRMDSLQFLPRPPIPDDVTAPAQSTPFAFEGWLFAWFFVPGLRRWEIGVVERRCGIEPRPSLTANSESLKLTDESPRERTLTLASKAIDAGGQLLERYCSTMLLLGNWEAPDPRDGFKLILGAASSAAVKFSQPTDVVRIVSRATGCEEHVVQSVIGYAEAMGLSETRWFRGAAIEVLMPGFGQAL